MTAAQYNIMYMMYLLFLISGVVSWEDFVDDKVAQEREAGE